MSTVPARPGLSLSAWLLLIVALLLAGAVAATLGLRRYEGAARFFGVGAEPAVQSQAVGLRGSPTPPAQAAATTPEQIAQVAVLEARLARLESTTRQVAGSAGRADALLVAFAARRAIDRGVSLGYLEPLLTDRFGPSHRQAVATVITTSRTPVRLDELTAEFDHLAPQLQRGGPDEGLWDATRRELSTLIAIRRSDRPNPRPSATVERVRGRLAAGQVDQGLAEAMRLPGIGNAAGWVQRARIYVSAHRALDEIESAALLAS
jgi:hypothetical protein